jgi:RND family efflux transporter MFP subunit
MTGTVRLAVWSALLASLVGLVACGGPQRSEEIEFLVPVQVRDVETGAFEDRVVATGTLRAVERVVLRGETSGVLLAGRDASGRRLAEGDRVEAGQLVAEITGEDVRLAARSEATRARFLEAQRDFESKTRLYEDDLISVTELRAAEATLADARLEWERSQLTESRSKLVTPIAGVLLQLARDENGQPFADGQLVNQGYVVAQIAPVGRLIADVDLVGPDVARVRPGMPARIRHQAGAADAISGQVVRLAPTLDTATRTLRAEVEVANPDGRLRPGMFVEVTVVAERREDVPVVPRDAVTEREGTKVVFVLDGQKVARRSVVPGLGDDVTVEIREGLEPGERIVVRGLETLTDGARVRVGNL